MQFQHLLKVRTALVSVFHKQPARELLEALHKNGVQIISTGGTLEYCNELGIPARAVEDLTGYPSILGGRVKTLHPAIFGGILARRDSDDHNQQMALHNIPDIDLVVVDLYPFEQTVNSGAEQQEIIEKIDIGGISLIRAAAKNFQHVLIIPSQKYFSGLIQQIDQNNCHISLEFRKAMAAAAFDISSHYDTCIFNYFNAGNHDTFKESINESVSLRYGENPHQQGIFFGRPHEVFDQIWGKALSYNNLLDIDGAVQLINEFENPTFAIIKHTNPCGVASRADTEQAWHAALAGDPVSAFGGILITNGNINEKTAYSINELFFEVLIAPGFDEVALGILKQKKNRIILKSKDLNLPDNRFRSVLNGVLWQSSDHAQTNSSQWKVVTDRKPSEAQTNDLVFGNKVVKHLKSNAIALVKNGQLLGSGVGQTSRIDALKQAILKAHAYGHDLKGAVMASDAFFPFADSVQIAHEAGITAVIQPGGSVRDQDSTEFCNNADITMVHTGTRHFKH